MAQLIIIIMIGLIISVFAALLPVILVALAIMAVIALILNIMKKRYFKSPEFLEQKNKVNEMVRDYNDIANYVKQIPNNNRFISSDTRYDNAHLATTTNTSAHNYKRDRNERTLGDDYVHSASLNVVRRASEEPIKYLCKYFGIDATEENLHQIEQIGENISRLDGTLKNLEKRRAKIMMDFDPPQYIVTFFEKELYEQLKMDIPDINIEYVKYIFEYVSAGGNSSQETTIEFNRETVEAVAKYLDQKIKYSKSAKAQRALMTEKLRNSIKKRDNYTCQNCGASIYDQDLLLLEIDHIVPVSKGGLSTPENLQTLCWKCNRSKGAKMI